MKNTKKVLSFVFVLGACFLFSACGEKTQVEQSTVPVSKEQAKVEKKLMNWMESGEAVECQIGIEEDRKITMMAKDEKVRVEGLPYASMSSASSEDFDPENADGISLTIGDWVYTWSKKSKEGVKFSLTEMEKMGEGLEDESGKNSDTWEEQVRGWEDGGIEYDCKKANLSDDLFEEPSGVVFVDMGEKMKNLTEMSEKLEAQQKEGEMPNIDDLKNMLPEGVEIPGME